MQIQLNDGFQWKIRRDGDQICENCVANLVGKFKGVHPMLSRWLCGEVTWDANDEVGLDFTKIKSTSLK